MKYKDNELILRYLGINKMYFWIKILVIPASYYFAKKMLSN